MNRPPPLRSRGAAGNPPNRFEPIRLERDPDWDPNEDPAPRTQLLRDLSQTILSRNESPDIPFRVSINPYRGCEHGCSYCYARPFHEYLGFSAGLDFETKIMVKLDAARLLRKELAASRWMPQVIALSGATDPYQPIERRLKLTRQCLEVLAEFRNPVGIVTKNQLVTRDIDLLQELAIHRTVAVQFSINSLDARLARELEPRSSSPRQRLVAMKKLADAGIPTGVLVAPVIPGLNDHEIPSILDAAKSSGASWATCQMLRLPGTVAPIFVQWVEEHEAARKDKILGRIRETRGGRLNDPRFGIRMRGTGSHADQTERLFSIACRRTGLRTHGPELAVDVFRRPPASQGELGLG